MFSIVIFDDELKGSKRTKGILEVYASKRNISLDIKTVNTEKELLDYVDTEKQIDVIFQDIRVREKADGITLAKHINYVAPSIAIVFLTGYIEYATDINDTKHICFVPKEELEKRLDVVFEKLTMVMVRRKRGFLTLHVKGAEIVLREETIQYIERIGRITRIQCKDEHIDVSDKLQEVERLLNPMIFVRCHNSFIVNFMEVREFKRSEFISNSGLSIPISRYKLNETREKFFVWSKLYV